MANFQMNQGAWRVELEARSGHPDPVGETARKALAHRGLEPESDIRSARGYLLPGSLQREQVVAVTERLLADPVAEEARIFEPEEIPEDGERRIIVRRMAGVADPEGVSASHALALLDIPLKEGEQVESLRCFRSLEPLDSDQFLKVATRTLSNPTIEEVTLADVPIRSRPTPTPQPSRRREVALLGSDENALATLSRDMSLALSLEEMQAVQSFFAAEGREPTDVELETLAQTWSEHCKHKTLTGPVRLEVKNADGSTAREKLYGNLLKETIFEVTRRLSPDWCWSVFSDNAGVVALTEEVGIAVKVETHNHPSALDPYGGAGTGIGGVIRDILGTGLGARPFASTDVFCVGLAGDASADRPPGTLHPDRVLEGVVAGVRDYGNRMGIPTVAGTVVRHPGYIANPLVFAGCIGEIPRDKVEKESLPGDFIVAVGGRTGRDGIHGATFSSEALHEESETVDAAAVQIGDPITEKKVLDILIEGRDRGLFRAVTDCGAGGFSSAVGEMGEGCGARVDLSAAPLKYPGLSYWEIWISEAQERMVFAVPPECLAELEELCRLHEVEATSLGTFTDTGRLVLEWEGETVADLPMDFLHGGVPQPERSAIWMNPGFGGTPWPDPVDEEALLLKALAHPSVVSKEWVVRQYDHEVQGGTVLKPYQGVEGAGPGDGTVVKPDPGRPEGVAIGCGLAVRITELDPWAGAACAVDEAVRNVVVAGGNPHRIALLDNFCWGDCRKPDRLGSLALAAEGCHDAALAFGAPFISGKDSLNNEYRVGAEEHPIPPTLLCTAVAPLADTAKAVGTPLQKKGNLLVLLGVTLGDGGASVASDLLELPESRPPRPDLEAAPTLVDALARAIQNDLVAAAHDLSEGGLAVAASEMALGSRLGILLDPDRVPVLETLPRAALLFSETPTRFLLEVDPDKLDTLDGIFKTLPWRAIGEVVSRAGVEFVNGPFLETKRLADANRGAAP